MTFRRSVALTGICLQLTMVAACGTPPRPFAPMQSGPVAEGPVVDPSSPERTITQEEVSAAIAPQPAMHPLMVARFMAALKDRHPEMSEQLDATKKRVLALNRLSLRAVHALRYEEMKDKTLAQAAAELQTWLARPAEMIAKIDTMLKQVEGKSLRDLAEIARRLPQVNVAMEQLIDRIPTADEQSAKGAGLRPLIIRRLFDSLAAKAPKLQAEITATKERLLALSPEAMRALHASMWEESKGKTVGELTSQLAGWMQKPAGYLAHIQSHLDRVTGMSAQALAALTAAYPQVLATYEDIMLAEPEAKTSPETEDMPTP